MAEVSEIITEDLTEVDSVVEWLGEFCDGYFSDLELEKFVNAVIHFFFSKIFRFVD